MLLLFNLTVFLSMSLTLAGQNEYNLPREVIDGPANIRNMDGSKIIFTLSDSTLVEAVESDGRYIIGLAVRLNEIQEKKTKISKGDLLIDFDGRTVGSASEELTPGLIGYWGEHTGFIRGYTAKQNIRSETIIENALADLILKKNYNVSFSDLEPFIANFSLRKYPVSDSNSPDYYYCLEGTMVDLSPRDRITLFIEEKKLIGIVHSRQLNLEQRTSFKLTRDHTFTPVTELPEERINEIIKERIAWYNSVD